MFERRYWDNNTKSIILRINLENIVNPWAAANTMGNEELTSSCLPVIQIYYQKIVDRPRFYRFSDLEGIPKLLSSMDGKPYQI